ncbi:MAG: hypothetical protein CL844_03780 [Crocinitomicaceae bacterium]|nr:hypothetical protein [Crocinitomicaceae bacterium]
MFRGGRDGLGGPNLVGRRVRAAPVQKAKGGEGNGGRQAAQPEADHQDRERRVDVVDVVLLVRELVVFGLCATTAAGAERER